jgi:hypothetical protein
MVELAGTRSLTLTRSEHSLLQTSLHRNVLLRLAAGNPHPGGAVPYQSRPI